MRSLSPLKLWLFVFALWGLFLSGLFASFLGSPGVIQALRLKSLLSAKQTQVAQLQTDLKDLQAEAGRLEHGKVAQQREIRKVLGYTAPDEIIFDFSRGM